MARPDACGNYSPLRAEWEPYQHHISDGESHVCVPVLGRLAEDSKQNHRPCGRCDFWKPRRRHPRAYWHEAHIERCDGGRLDNTQMSIDVTDVALAAGTLYYVAIACDNATAAFASYVNVAVDSLWQAQQVKITDTAYPIPASPTLATPTSGQRTPVLFLEFAA